MVLLQALVLIKAIEEQQRLRISVVASPMSKLRNATLGIAKVQSITMLVHTGSSVAFAFGKVQRMPQQLWSQIMISFSPLLQSGCSQDAGSVAWPP